MVNDVPESVKTETPAGNVLRISARGAGFHAAIALAQTPDRVEAPHGANPT